MKSQLIRRPVSCYSRCIPIKDSRYDLMEDLSDFNIEKTVHKHNPCNYETSVDDVSASTRGNSAWKGDNMKDCKSIIDLCVLTDESEMDESNTSQGSPKGSIQFSHEDYSQDVNIVQNYVVDSTLSLTDALKDCQKIRIHVKEGLVIRQGEMVI